jgi:hypothetical protein
MKFSKKFRTNRRAGKFEIQYLDPAGGIFSGRHSLKEHSGEFGANRQLGNKRNSTEEW